LGELVRRPSPEVHHSPELKEMLSNLNLDDRRLRWVNDMDDVLKENMFASEQVQKRLIPRHYVERYGVNNLYRYRHPEAYRSCYTLVNYPGVGVCPLVIDLLSHPEYERLFGYKMRG